MVTIRIPDFSLVVLVGASGSGKSTFARKHFLPTEVVSSDVCRALVADDENALDASDDAFALLHTIAATRLKRHRLTVIDATNVLTESRKVLVRLAGDWDCPLVAIVLDLPERICEERNAVRAERQLSGHIVRRHVRDLRRSLPRLDREGFRHVVVLRTAEEVEGATVERVKLWDLLAGTSTRC